MRPCASAAVCARACLPARTAWRARREVESRRETSRVKKGEQLRQGTTSALSSYAFARTDWDARAGRQCAACSHAGLDKPTAEEWLAGVFPPCYQVACMYGGKHAQYLICIVPCFALLSLKRDIARKVVGAAVRKLPAQSRLRFLPSRPGTQRAWGGQSNALAFGARQALAHTIAYCPCAPGPALAHRVSVLGSVGAC